MSQHDDKRRKLLGRLNRRLAYTAPMLALVAGGAILQATASDSAMERGVAPVSETSLLLASNHAEAEAEGEAEGGPNAAVARPDDYSPDYSETGDNPEDMLARGKALYYDTALSTNGLSCSTCHGSDGRDTGYNPTFQQPFPHRVAMANNQFGMSEVHADEMVQVCMIAPMAAEPLEWGSEELTSLSAYMVEVQKRVAGEPHDL